MIQIIRDNLTTINVNDLTDFGAVVKELTIKNPKYAQAKRFSRFKVNIQENLMFFKANKQKETITVPRSYNYNKYIKNKDDIITIDNTADGYEISNRTRVTLRDYQEEIFTDFKNLHAEGHTDIMMLLKTGGGKTITALRIAALYKRNVLVVALTNQLLNQWVTLINKPHPELGYTLFPDWAAGKYDNKKPDKLYDITFATYSQLAGAEKSGFREAYPVEFYDRFGHIIFDEYHRAGALSFSTINNRATCKYKTTLTATFRRADGLEKILGHYISKTVTSSKKSTPARVILKPILDSRDETSFITFSTRAVGAMRIRKGELVRGIKGDKTVEGKVVAKGKTKRGVYAVTIIYKGRPVELEGYKIYPRTNLTTAVIDSYVSSNISLYMSIIKDAIKYRREGRKVIFVSKSIKTLFLAYYFLDKAGLDSVGLIMSDKRKKYKDFIKSVGYDSPGKYMDFCMRDAKTILGIEKISKEGMDVDKADTLIIINPVKDPEQMIGRIDRDYADKKEKLVIAYDYDLPLYTNIIHGKNGFVYWVDLLGHILQNVRIR